MLKKVQMQKEMEKRKNDPYGRSNFYPYNHRLLDDYFKNLEERKAKASVWLKVERSGSKNPALLFSIRNKNHLQEYISI